MIFFFWRKKATVYVLKYLLLCFMIYSNENIFIQELRLLLAAEKLVLKIGSTESWHTFRRLTISPARQAQPSSNTRTRWNRTAWTGSTRLSVSATCIFMDGPSLTPTMPLPCHSCLKCLRVNKTFPWQILQCRKGFGWWKMSLVVVRKRGCSASTVVPIGKRGGPLQPLNHSPRATASCSASPWV